jgi:hypothetical protein
MEKDEDRGFILKKKMLKKCGINLIRPFKYRGLSKYWLGGR